jgi:hypothetical protein
MAQSPSSSPTILPDFESGRSSRPFSIKDAYREAIAAAGKTSAIVDAIETTLGWDTIYEPRRLSKFLNL